MLVQDHQNYLTSMSRIAEIEKLRSRMRQHHFVAISGPRNTGKSRICRELQRSLEAEVKNMREIERRYKGKAGMKWKVGYIKLSREDNPFDVLTSTIAGPGTNILLSSNEKVDPLFESKVKGILREPDSMGLIRIYNRYLREKKYNFLLIFDQFENLFFSTILSQQEKHAFVRLLLHSSLNQRQLYVLVALRPPKADLWKTNFKDLSFAIERCRFRLYNPNQRELESVIDQAFQQEKSRLLGDDFSDELLSPDWLVQQPIYKRVAMPRIQQIADVTGETMKKEWEKLLRESAPPNQRIFPTSTVKHITKQLRGITDTIWPELVNSANIGHLEEDDREDIIADLKSQLTDMLTTQLLRRMSRHLAEELYFDQEPLVQIEKHVRQLMKHWAEATADLRAERTRRRKRIKTVFLAEQKSVGAASGDLRFDSSLPLETRAEKAYNALKTTLDKRIAKKALTILGRTAQNASVSTMTLDSLGFAMGRFSSRLNDVLQVFVMSGALVDEPHNSWLPNTKIELAKSSLVDEWTRLSEWVLNKPAGSLSGTTAEGRSTLTGGAASTVVSSVSTPTREVDLSLREDFGDLPEDTQGLIKRAEAVYSSLTPSIKKRVAKKVYVHIAKSKDGIPPKELKAAIGRFESHIEELLEYFVRQGILKYTGPKIGFADPDIPKGWKDLKSWIKE